MDALAFTNAHRDHRVRGAFRLLGALGSLAIAFVESLDGLISWHDARYIVIPLPVVAGALLGECAVSVRRILRAHESPIPRARLVRSHTSSPTRE